MRTSARNSGFRSIDLASVLGEEELAGTEAAGFIDEARATLTRIGAQPFIDRLDAALEREPASSTARRPTAKGVYAT
jgi:hypothetical protein